MSQFADSSCSESSRGMLSGGRLEYTKEEWALVAASKAPDKKDDIPLGMSPRAIAESEEEVEM